MRNLDPSLKRSGGKTVLLISDHPGLSQAIAFTLETQLLVRVIQIECAPVEPAASGRTPDCDLVVVAVSSPSSEPVVALAWAGLTALIGKIPLLIISDRDFRPALDARITHLDFPFDDYRLCGMVSELLGIL